MKKDDLSKKLVIILESLCFHDRKYAGSFREVYSNQSGLNN